MIAFLGRVNDLLGKINGTNFKTVNAVTLDYFTFGWLVTDDLMGKQTNTAALGLWLGFLAALHGVAYASFAKQRDTDWTALKIKSETPAPATTTSTTQTAGPAITTTKTGDQG